MISLRTLIVIASWSSVAFGIQIDGEPISAGIDARQMNFGGGFGGFGGQRFPQQPFGGSSPDRPQQQDQQNLPPLPGFNQDAPAGIFQLAVDKFPVKDDPLKDFNKFPGINSGFISPNPPVQTAQRLQTQVEPLTNGVSCAPNNKSIPATGVCSNIFDVVIGRKCVGTRTAPSDNCGGMETCCFKLADKEVIDINAAFDEVPCGLRRTPQLAQRELQRVADELDVDQIPLRILGGLEAFQTEICWQAAVMIDGKYVCGAAVLNSKHVITAGHCLNDVESLGQIEVITGIKDLKNEGKCADHFHAANVTFNDNYDPRSLTFDMVIIELNRPITRTNCTCKVCMPDTNIDKQSLASLDCIVTGFGTTQVGKTPNDVGPLNIANVSVIPELPNDHSCSDRLHLSPAIPKKFMPDPSMICAIGEDPLKVEDTCDLDGGSPLACRMDPKILDVYTLVGLSSWGLPCGKNIARDSSGREVRIPTVYSYVRPSLSWIDQNIRL